MPVYVQPPHRRGNEKRKGPVQVLILIVCREELGVGLLSLSPSFFFFFQFFAFITLEAA